MGRIDLGLSLVDFWALTPREYRAMLDRQRENRERAEQRADLRAGVVAAAIGNAMGGKRDKTAFKPSDYFTFPAIGKTPAQAKAPVRNQAAVEAGWIAWSKAAGAVVPDWVKVSGVA